MLADLIGRIINSLQRSLQDLDAESLQKQISDLEFVSKDMKARGQLSGFCKPSAGISTSSERSCKHTMPSMHTIATMFTLTSKCRAVTTFIVQWLTRISGGRLASACACALQLKKRCWALTTRYSRPRFPTAFQSQTHPSGERAQRSQRTHTKSRPFGDWIPFPEILDRNLYNLPLANTTPA